MKIEKVTSLRFIKQDGISCRSWISVISTRQHSLHSTVCQTRARFPVQHPPRLQFSSLVVKLQRYLKSEQTDRTIFPKQQSRTNPHALPFHFNNENNPQEAQTRDAVESNCFFNFVLLPAQFTAVVAPTTWLGFVLVTVLSSHKCHTVLSNATAAPPSCLLSAQTTRWPSQLPAP